MNKDFYILFFPHSESLKSSMYFTLRAHVRIVFGPSTTELLNSQHMAYGHHVGLQSSMPLLLGHLQPTRYSRNDADKQVSSTSNINYYIFSVIRLKIPCMSL